MYGNENSAEGGFDVERTILLLGNPELYEVSREVKIEELHQMEQVREDLKDTLLAFRARYGVGRAIAAPQIGVKKRVIYRHLDTPVLFINPRLAFPEQEMIDVLDDCMSFPDLLVRVKRYKRCIIYYKDLSELIQHEYDHLDGILATLRAVDERALVMKPH